jgi:hypothetical protein
LWDEIIKVLGETPDGVKLAECRKEWVARGYNTNSVKWATEWYKNGITGRNVNNRNNNVQTKYREEY